MKRIFWCVISVFFVFFILTIVSQSLKESPRPEWMPLQQFVSICFSQYFKDWGIPLSAAATFMLAWGAFWAISDERHHRLIEAQRPLKKEVRKWAQDALRVLARQDIIDSLTAVEYENIKSELLNVIMDAVNAISLAVKIGGDTRESVQYGYERLCEFRELFESKETSGDELINKLLEAVGGLTGVLHTTTDI